MVVPPFLGSFRRKRRNLRLDYWNLLLHIRCGQGAKEGSEVSMGSLDLLIQRMPFHFDILFERMVLNEASLCAGIMVGNVASGYIYAATNALVLFSIAGSLMMFALMYVLLFVPESLNPGDIHTGVSNFYS